MMKAAEKAHEAVQLAQKTLQQTLKEGGSTAAGQRLCNRSTNDLHGRLPDAPSSFLCRSLILASSVCGALAALSPLSSSHTHRQ
jgi:hypothetical protein